MISISDNYSSLRDIIFAAEYVFTEYPDSHTLDVAFTNNTNSDNLPFAELVVTFSVDESSYIVDCQYPLFVPEEYLIKVSRYFTLLNNVMKKGKFILDLDDGEVRFRTSGYFKTSSTHVLASLSLALRMVIGESEAIPRLIYSEDSADEVFRSKFSGSEVIGPVKEGVN